MEKSPRRSTSAALDLLESQRPGCAGTYHGVSNKHLERYLQEFVYRFNRRHFEFALFEHVIRAAATAPPLTYDQLTAERIG